MSVYSGETELQPQQNWGGTSNPEQHDPSQYRYLVHAINPYASINARIITAYDARDGIEYDEAWGDQSINMYDQPERVAERVSLSMSLIDQDHNATWGNGGLIVQAPEANIVLTSTVDTGANNNNLDTLLLHGSEQGVMSGDQLIKNSESGIYNEVVAVADRDGATVGVTGFFYKITSTGEPVNETIAARMRIHAERLGLPIVEIVNENPYAIDRVDRFTGRTDKSVEKIAANYNGRRYFLDGFDDSHQFKVMGESGRTYFCSPEELKAAVEFAMITRGVSEEEAERILFAHSEADMRRKTPTARFDDEGEFQEIVYHDGYGDGEQKYSLYKSGYANRTDMTRQAIETQKTMLSMGGRQMIGIGEDRITSPLSPYEADKMVREACDGLDQIHAQKVREWYKEKSGVVVKQWDYHVSSRRYFGKVGLIQDNF